MDAARLTILGVLSLIIWALLLVVTLKYVVILLRADNNGEGGTLSLMALTQRALGRRSDLIFILGIIGASLFYGDSIITPAISVLSAVEGVKLIAPGLESWVVPLTIFIILMLFLFQSRGTARVAGLFGPIMMVWFSLLAVMGLWQIIQDPEVLAAFNPVYAVHLLLSHGKVAFFILGAIFLAVTGGEALYADLGHFGRTPIRFAWLWVVLPALVLNYLGQGALVLQHPETLESPFFHMAPDILLIPLVLLATAATVIASQAVITGTYSLTRQAIQLGTAAAYADSAHLRTPSWPDIYAPRDPVAGDWRGVLWS
jgi:KUP system potassium uptake protein